MVAVVWVGVVVLLVLWSLGAWAVHGLAVWSLSHAETVASGVGSAQLGDLPPWLRMGLPVEWLTSLHAWVQAGVPAVEGLLGWVGSLASALSMVVWGLWSVGAVLLVGVGVVAHVVLRRVWPRSGVSQQ